ncbi:MAG: L-2-hydroxyglutarate oxidase [Deltaproteobacteria bacterium]|nr:L-2-hydroxyglutarate oxidase [Deltaproteobacteria bacterium]
MNADIIIIGGGIIGCATAMRLLQAKPSMKLLVLEKEGSVAQHQSGRNSGVIHSGLYYKPGSLKATNCRRGYRQLIDFCQRENIAHEICGKLVIATSAEDVPRLEELRRRGIANGLRGLRWLKAEEILETEPNCSGVAGLLVPQTGIVDYGVVARKYSEKIQELGAQVKLGEEVIDIRSQSGKVEVIGRNQSWMASSAIVCAGLQADRLAVKTTKDLPVRIIPFRGEYYKLKESARYLVKNLIYPVPDPKFPFLGVHFTRMIDGGIECGPNAVLAFGREAYRKTDFSLRDTWETLAWPGFRKMARQYWRMGFGEWHRSVSKRAFVKALQKLVPTIQSGDLESGRAGIRAQACDREGNLLDDFDIRTHGPVIQVCNAPSPAATASLAIADVLVSRVIECFK